MVPAGGEKEYHGDALPPEVLIVGDASNQRSLIRAVKEASYEVTLCAAVELEDRMASPPPPELAILCISDIRVERVLSRLRRTRAGAAVPVILCGSYGGDVPTMDDALELGADFFLEEPIDGAVLKEALIQLAGLPGSDAQDAVAPRAGATSGGDIGRYADPPGGEEPLDESLLDAAFSDSLGPAESGGAGVEVPRLGEHPSASEFQLDLDGEDDDAPSPESSRETWSDGASSGANGGAAAERDGGRSRSRAHAPEQGRLEETCVPELLWGLFRSHGTARVHLERDDVVKEIWVVRGHPRFATSSEPSDRLIELLGRRSLIPAEKLETARTLVGRDERRAGEVLVEAGFLKDEEFDALLSEHLVAIVWSVLGWTKGSFEVFHGEEVDEPTQIKSPLAPLLIEGLAYYTDRRDLERWIGSMGQRTALKERLQAPQGFDQVAAEFGLSGMHVAWMRRLGGSDSLATMSTRAHDGQGLLALVYVLALEGLISITSVRADRRGHRSSEHIDEDRIAARMRLVRDGNYFALLGLGADARPMEVRRAFHELSQTFQPSAIEPAVRSRRADDLVELRAALMEAMEVLSDEVLRSAYLAHFEPEPEMLGEHPDETSSS